MVTVKSTVAVGVPPIGRLFSMTARAFALALISDLKVPVVPSSATDSIPALAVPPLLQKVTLSFQGVRPFSFSRLSLTSLDGTPVQCAAGEGMMCVLSRV